MAGEDHRTVKVSKLPRDAVGNETNVKGLFGRFAQIVDVRIFLSKKDEKSCHGLLKFVWKDDAIFQAMKHRVNKGCFGCGPGVVRIELLSAKGLAAEERQQGIQGQVLGGVPSAQGKGPKREHSANTIAKGFHAFLYGKGNQSLLDRCGDRQELDVIISEYARNNATDILARAGRTAESICSDVVGALRRLQLMKSKRRKSKKPTLCIFASPTGGFPTAKQQRDTSSRVLSNLLNNKGGVSVKLEGDYTEDSVILPGQARDLTFSIVSQKFHGKLSNVSTRGPQRRAFALKSSPTTSLSPGTITAFRVCFTSAGAGIYKTTILFQFEKMDRSSFAIARNVCLRSGDPDIQEFLKPTKPYKKIRRKGPIVVDDGQPVEAPKSNGQGKSMLAGKLPQYMIPKYVKESDLKALFNSITPRDCVDSYKEFWKLMLWASEHQANKDITLFDMEHVKLIRQGNLYKLSVPGLAEGRPSVLRGDLVPVTVRNKTYFGRVRDVQLLTVSLEFHASFHQNCDCRVDEVTVRFKFSRTTFRTSHFGCEIAPLSMGKPMLYPDLDDDNDASTQKRLSRSVVSLRWANQSLNREQKLAVENIVKGQGRPLPYILFGPPGTGKTTTIVEAVYQLIGHPDRLKVLLVAPSNDAADILAAKLAQYFPPSEMRRMLAFSRSVTDLPEEVQSYCSENASEEQQRQEILRARIVVSTVNLAARFSFLGVPVGYFDVLVVDEAGHAIEPEVVAVAATLMDYNKSDKKKSGQVILAGDPKQLGPVISSRTCEKYGLSMSYMERLTLREIYGRRSDGQYPSYLLTKLVRNYRSHPAILKLPNKMFYDDELEIHGDRMRTHSLCRWEHLAKQGFPVLMHAVHGENLREANSPSWYNPHEAEVVVQYVDLLVNQTKPPVEEKDIGIITPYARQVQKIRLALRVRDIRNVKVGSVETFQGQERRVIILSTVRAESGLIETHDKKYNLGFVANEKRFNVAVTRAQALLIVIGHPDVLATDKDHWLPLLRHCKENGSWLGQDWDEVEEGDDDGEIEEGDAVVETEDDEDEAGISHRVSQESVAFINREE